MFSYKYGKLCWSPSLLCNMSCGVGLEEVQVVRYSSTVSQGRVTYQFRELEAAFFWLCSQWLTVALAMLQTIC